MWGSRPRSRRWLSLGALCASWVVALVAAPRSSLADCSHAEKPTFSIAAPGLGLSDDAPAPRTVPASPSRPRPCSGPQCSSKPAPAPGASTVPRFRISLDRWAWLDLPADLDGSRAAPSRAEDSPARPISNPSSVFHPPRRTR